MILIADSGATKTDWMIISEKFSDIIKTEGINPFHQSEEYIRNTIHTSLLPQIEKLLSDIHPSMFSNIYFYGAGCLPEVAEKIKFILHEFFTKTNIYAETDLMGAARALCGRKPGIACIMGTGSNSCMYDGERIIQNTPPLGYILGDEGSGAHLGKMFIANCLKKQLPEFLMQGLTDEYGFTTEDILNRVYKQPQANRFLASVTPYIYKMRKDPNVKTFLKECFSSFFLRNVMNYDISLNISFTGSVAWYFQEEIKETAKFMGLKTGIFMKSPIEGLKKFHNNQ